MKREISLDHLFKKLVMCSACISGAVLVFSAVLLIADVAGRFILKHSILGAMETITMLMVWIAYFSICYTLMEHSHIQMTSFTDKFKNKSKYLNQFVIYLLCTVFFIALAKIGFDVFYSSLIRQEIAQASVKIYLWIGKLPICIGSILMVMQAGAMCIAAAINLKNCKYFDNKESERKESAE